MENVSIGQRIALLRKEKGMTQIKLASLIGITNKTLSQWETGAEGRVPDIDYIGKLADALEVDCDYLIRGVRTEHVDVFSEVGLTDKAVEQLRFIKSAGAGGIEIVNFVLSHENLIRFLTAILELQTIVKWGMPDIIEVVSAKNIGADMLGDILHKTDIFLELHALVVMSDIIKDYIKKEIRKDEK